MSNRERVLVVDEISDTADVLEAVLEPRGVAVHRVCRWAQAENRTVENRPIVVVYDADSLRDASEPTDGNWQGVPQIILGTIGSVVCEQATCETGESENAQPRGKDATVASVDRRYLQKPFQFAELVQAIEAVIAARSVAGRVVDG